MSAEATVALEPIPFPPSLDTTHFRQFGREVKGLHPRDLAKDPLIFQAIEKALYEHDLLLFRNVDLTPEEQYALVKVFDSSAEQYGHGHGTVYNHEGIPELTLKHGHHKTFHKTFIPSEDEEKFEATRFFRWHMDAALYRFDPPKVTALYGLRVPEGPQQVVRYDDGSGDELPVPLGTTAFISGKVMFDILPRKWKSFAVRARAQYAPHPFEWVRRAKAVSTGFGIVSEGLETPFDQLSTWEEAKRKTYPFLWKNPVTGSLHFQVHPMTITDIFVDPLPSSTAHEVEAPYPGGGHITDLGEIRRILSEMQRPGIAPHLVYPHPWKEKDLVLFHNRGLVHSVVGLFNEDQIRLFHQCNLASSDAPRGPSQADIGEWCRGDREEVP